MATSPLPKISDASVTAGEVFATPLRQAVILRLGTHGPQTVTELAAYLGRGKRTIDFALHFLEERGVVVASRPRGERNGVSVEYRTDPARLARLVDSLGRTALPPRVRPSE